MLSNVAWMCKASSVSPISMTATDMRGTVTYCSIGPAHSFIPILNRRNGWIGCGSAVRHLQFNGWRGATRFSRAGAAGIALLPRMRRFGSSTALIPDRRSRRGENDWNDRAKRCGAVLDRLGPWRAPLTINQALVSPSCSEIMAFRRSEGRESPDFCQNSLQLWRKCCMCPFCYTALPKCYDPGLLGVNAIVQPEAVKQCHDNDSLDGSCPDCKFYV